MCDGAKNVAGNAEQASRIVSCSWSAALECTTLTKKREPNSSAPRLKNDGLKVELHNKLHGASIVGEGLCRIVEGTAVNANETSDAGISD